MLPLVIQHRVNILEQCYPQMPAPMETRTEDCAGGRPSLRERRPGCGRAAQRSRDRESCQQRQQDAPLFTRPVVPQSVMPQLRWSLQ